MTAIRDQYGNKVLKADDGTVLVESGGNTTLELKIDADLQIDGIVKDGSNLVSQITEKANNIAFVQSDNAKKRVFNYNGYYEGNSVAVYKSDKTAPTFNSGTLKIEFYAKLQNIAVSQRLIECDEAVNRGWSVYTSATHIVLFNGITTVQNVIPITVADENIWKLYTIYLDYDTPAINGIVDGVVRYGGFFTPIPLSNPNNNPWYLFGSGNPAASSWIGDISWLTFETGVDIFNQKLGVQSLSPFTFYKRHANKSRNIKAFLSSRYLKDAVINSSDEITTIYDEQGNTYTSSGTNAVKITNKGLYFQGSAYLQRTGFEIGTNDFFIGKWVNNSNSNDANIYQNSGITIDKNSGNYRVNGNVIAAFNTNTNEYVWVLRKTNVLYYGVDGLQGGSIADSTNYTLSDTIIGSNNFIGYIDDVLPSIGDSILNPATFVSGPKKLEPPRRRSLDSHILQFPNTIIQL